MNRLEPSEEDMFFMIWNPRGHAPTCQHETLESAERECQRLARNAPGEHFYLLCAVKRFEVQETPVHEERLNASLFDRFELPF